MLKKREEKKRKLITSVSIKVDSASFSAGWASCVEVKSRDLGRIEIWFLKSQPRFSQVRGVSH